MLGCFAVPDLGFLVVAINLFVDFSQTKLGLGFAPLCEPVPFRLGALVIAVFERLRSLPQIGFRGSSVICRRYRKKHGDGQASFSKSERWHGYGAFVDCDQNTSFRSQFAIVPSGSLRSSLCYRPQLI